VLTAIYTLATLLFIATPSTADEWTQFRGSMGDGISTATHVPVNWTATEHVVWKQAIPGLGWSSPVLSRGKLYLTTAEELSAGVTSLRALCVDTADGHIVWNVEVFRPEPSAVKEHHSKNSVASPSPILTSDRLYVHFGHLGTAALDLNGKILWRQSKLSYKPRHGNGGSPVLVGNSLIFSCDAAEDPFVVALNCDNGEVRWKTPRNTTAVKTFSFCTPTVIELDGVTQVIIPGSGFVGAYNPQDGKEIWRVGYGEGYSVVPRPVFANGLLFVATGFERPTLLAIDPKGATGDATDKHVMWSATKGAPLTPSMLAVRDELYTVTDNGVATCFNSRTGDVHWTQRLAGNFSASPVFADGRIYFQNEAGTTFVVKAGIKYELLATNDIEERTLASLAPTDGAVFIRSESHLWRIGN
jgi:outer membrane protein assembly factor BamB